MMSMISRRWLDLGERALLTYVETAAGLLLADSTHMLSLGALRAAGVAALPAALSAIKSAFALGLGPAGTASLLPAPKPVPSAPEPEAPGGAPAAK